MHGNASSVFMSFSPRRSPSLQSQDSSISGRWSPGKSGSYDEYPLGRTRFHDHYITPVPPMYVTEYEAKYTWPEPLNHRPKSAPAERKSAAVVPPWETLEKVVDEIANGDPLAASSKQQIHEHKLDANIEAAYHYYKKKLGDEGGEEKKKEEPKKKPAPAPPRPPAEVTPEKMRLFCESVEALKRGVVVQK
jgi:hypothetical protein